MKLSVIIPSYNEASTIEAVLEAVVAVALGGLTKEVIAVDGNSTDGTRQILRRHAATGAIRVIYEAQREGKGAALRKGIAAATGEIVLVQDADLELDPRDWGGLLAPILRGEARVVYGSRLLGGTNPFPPHTYLFNRFLAGLYRWLYPHSRLSDVLTGYKVFAASLIKNMRLFCRTFDIEVEITGQLLRRGVPIHEVPVSYRPRNREAGKKIHWHDGLLVLMETVRQRLGWRPIEPTTAVAEGRWKSGWRAIRDFCGAPLRILMLPDAVCRTWGITSLEEERIMAVLPHCRGKLLDVGCGANGLVRRYGNGVGIDVRDWGGEALVVPSTEQLPFADESFDTVSFLACLNHIPHREAVLREAWRVLRPSGQVILTMVSPISGFIAHSLVWHSEEKHRGGMAHGECHGIRHEALLRLLYEAGFEFSCHRRFLYGINNLYIAQKASPLAAFSSEGIESRRHGEPEVVGTPA